MTKSIKLKFVFANKDGLVLEQTTEMDTLVSEIKSTLIASWPTGDLNAARAHHTIICD